MKRNTQSAPYGGGKPAAGGGGGPSGGQPPKKPRFDEDFETNFEDDLTGLDDATYEKIEGVVEDNSEFASGKWIRPKEANWNAKEKPLLFHWLDLDMVSGSPLESNPAGGQMVGSTDLVVPVVR